MPVRHSNSIDGEALTVSATHSGSSLLLSGFLPLISHPSNHRFYHHPFNMLLIFILMVLYLLFPVIDKSSTYHDQFPEYNQPMDFLHSEHNIAGFSEIKTTNLKVKLF